MLPENPKNAVKYDSMSERPADPGFDDAASGAAQDPPPKGKFVCLDTTYLSEAQQGLEISLLNRALTIGREADNAIQINSTKLSRYHARIVPGAGRWGIEDLGSTNGVRINKERIEKAWLNPGDRVDIGAIPFRYELVAFEVPDQDSHERGDLDKTVLVGRGSGPAMPARPKPPVIPPPQPAKRSNLIPILVILGLIGVAAYFVLGQ